MADNLDKDKDKDDKDKICPMTKFHSNFNNFPIPCLNVLITTLNCVLK